MEINTFISKIKKEDRRFLNQLRFVQIICFMFAFIHIIKTIRYFSIDPSTIYINSIDTLIFLSLGIISIKIYNNYNKINYSLSTKDLLIDIIKRYNVDYLKLSIIFSAFIAYNIFKIYDSGNFISIISPIVFSILFILIIISKYKKIRNNAKQLLKELNAD